MPPGEAPSLEPWLNHCRLPGPQESSTEHRQAAPTFLPHGFVSEAELTSIRDSIMFLASRCGRLPMKGKGRGPGGSRALVPPRPPRRSSSRQERQRARRRTVAALASMVGTPLPWLGEGFDQANRHRYRLPCLLLCPGYRGQEEGVSPLAEPDPSGRLRRQAGRWRRGGF